MLAPDSESDHRRRELVVVSDFQRSTWAKADFSPLPADTQIQLESTAPPEPLANLAILRVEGRTAGSQASTQLDVEVGNYSPTARKDHRRSGPRQFELAAVGHVSARPPHHAHRGDRRAAAGLAVGRGAAGGSRRRPGRRQRLSLRAARPAAADLRVDDPAGGRAKGHVEPVSRMCPGADGEERPQRRASQSAVSARRPHRSGRARPHGRWPRAT